MDSERVKGAAGSGDGETRESQGDDLERKLIEALGDTEADVIKVGNSTNVIPDGDSPDFGELRGKVEPWLSALFQSEHLSLLTGSGLSIGVCNAVGCDSVDMSQKTFDAQFNDIIQTRAENTAERAGRESANIEDQLRAATELLNGLRVIGRDALDASYRPSDVRNDINRVLAEFSQAILGMERELSDGVGADSSTGRELLTSFLLSFANRPPSKDRLGIFTTNYDRILEWGCDEVGLRIIDRFVGRVRPRFRASRVDVDYHYNPPGIRGEPRYVEGVVKLSKLHGSVDWIDTSDGIVRQPVPFGPSDVGPYVPTEPYNSLMVFPNASKGVETAHFPYSELLRDFAASICRPNSVLVTYGYGFGDSHLNRVIEDMLARPSTHLVVISYDRADGRIEDFIQEVGQNQQISVIVGSTVAALPTLTTHLLPKPAIERAKRMRTDIERARGVEPAEGDEGN